MVWFRNSILLMFVSLAYFTSLSQELQFASKLRIAQSLQQAGEWERAVVIFEELYKTDPNNYSVVNGLQQSYSQLKEYDKALLVIQNWLKRQPHDVNFKIILGSLYYDSGKEKTADSVWQSVLETNSSNLNLYRLIANELIERRLFDKCIRVYLDARLKNKNDILFADEIGTLYSAMQQYDLATKEYANLVKNNSGQLGLAQSRLSNFISKKEAINSVLEILVKEIKNSYSNVALHRLYAWALIENQSYADALKEYQIIDKLTNSNGNEVYDFGQRLLRDKVPEVAAKAFKEVIDDNKNSTLIPQAKFGYASAMEAIANMDEEKKAKPDYNNVISVYNSLITEYKNTELALQALYRVGDIKYEKFFDLDGALNDFNQIRERILNGQASKKPSDIYFETTLKIGEIQVARNNLEQANKEYELACRIASMQFKEQAIFKLAELNYYKANFDSAISLLKQITANLNTDMANDALQLLYFIQENASTAAQALREFADADLLMRQRKYSESLLRFKNIVKQYSNAFLIDDAMMKTGEILVKLNQPIEAITAFNFVVDSIKFSILQDRAQFRIAEIYHTVLKDIKQASANYEKLLEKFPNSLFAEESRKRIRLLRGENLIQ